MRSTPHMTGTLIKLKSQVLIHFFNNVHVINYVSRNLERTHMQRREIIMKQLQQVQVHEAMNFKYNLNV